MVYVCSIRLIVFILLQDFITGTCPNIVVLLVNKHSDKFL